MNQAILGVIVVLYCGFLWRNVSPHAGGSDTSGYLNSARLIGQGRLFAPARDLPGHAAGAYGDRATIPLGFMVRGPGRLAPTYPIGYPLHLLASSWFGWKHAAQIASMLLAVAGGGLLYAYARRLGLGRDLALGGVAILWGCPLFAFASLLPMSDLPALVWGMAVLHCALAARDSWRWGLWCGAAAGVAVLVRPTNLLLAFPLLVAIGIRPRSWLAVAAGGLPFAVILGGYNLAVYGSLLTTGYGDVATDFSFSFAWPNLSAFAHWIPRLLSPLVLLAVACPFLAIARRRPFVVLTIWAATLIGFYSFYSHSGETWWYLRFILPAFPALILAMLCVLETLRLAGGVNPRYGRYASAGLIALVVAWQVSRFGPLDVLNLESGEHTYPESARWARQHLPADSVIFCMQVSGAFFYYSDFLLYRWDLVREDRLPQLLADVRKDHRPVYAVLYEFEKDKAVQRLGGQWKKLNVIGNATVWELAPEPAAP